MNTKNKASKGENGLDSDDDENGSKERHSSGESNDSAVSFSVPTSPTKLNPDDSARMDSPSRFLVIPSDFCKSMKDCNLRGILRRPRCSSEGSAPTGLLRMMSSPACSSSGSSGKYNSKVALK